MAPQSQLSALPPQAELLCLWFNFVSKPGAGVEAEAEMGEASLTIEWEMAMGMEDDEKIVLDFDCRSQPESALQTGMLNGHVIVGPLVGSRCA